MPRSYTFVAHLSQTRMPARPSVSACAPRPALSPTVRRLRHSGRHALPRVRALAAADRRSGLRPLRGAGRLARGALPRVCGSSNRLYLRPGCGRVRRARPCARLRVEGTRAARSRLVRRRDRRRGRVGAGRSAPDHVRAARRRPEPETGTSPAGPSRPRAGASMGSPGAADARADAPAPAAARARPSRAAAQCARRLPGDNNTRKGAPRGRRLHHRRDRLGRGNGAAACRRLVGRRRHLRARREAMSQPGKNDLGWM